MYELIFLNENDGYIDCPAKIGIVKTDGGNCIAIDSGSDKDAAKKVLKALEAEGLTLTAVYNTHAHADHIGGNRLLQNRTGCKIFASGIESAIASNPILEPVTLYGGFPFLDLTHKFLLAEQSEVLPLTETDLPDGFSLIHLPGHSPDMVGFLTPDGTAYIGDTLASKSTLDKYKTVFLYDIKAHLETLGLLKNIKAKQFVSAHAEVLDDITELTEYNRLAVLETANTIEDFCKGGITFDILLKKVFDKYSVNMNAVQYVLTGSTVRSYLSYLINGGKISVDFNNNIATFKSNNGENFGE